MPAATTLLPTELDVLLSVLAILVSLGFLGWLFGR